MNKKFRSVVVIAVIMAIAGIFSQSFAKGGELLSGIVNINTATSDELTILPGIGPSKAAAIVEYRQNSKFKNEDDLVKVRGIGTKLLDKIRPYISVEGPTTAKLEDDLSIN